MVMFWKYISIENATWEVKVLIFYLVSKLLETDLCSFSALWIAGFMLISRLKLICQTAIQLLAYL